MQGRVPYGFKKEKHGYRVVANFTPTLPLTQRFGEWDAPYPRPEPNRALLLPKKLKQYGKPPASKPISTLVPADSNRDEFLRKSIAAFAEGVKNLGDS